MAVDFSSLVSFYNLGHRRDGNWQPLFESDDLFILSMICALDLERCRADADVFLQRYTACSAAVSDPPDPVTVPAYLLACRLDDWYRGFERCPTPTGEAMLAAVGGVISDRLKPQLRQLRALIGAGLEGSQAGLRNFHEIWDAGADMSASDSAGDAPGSIGNDPATAYRENFHAFYNAVKYLQQRAGREFANSFGDQMHEPAAAMYVAFIVLFGRIQSHLNGFTNRHWSFYYHDVLGIRPRSRVGDQAYLVLSPAASGGRVHVPAGTEFVARVGESRKEVIFRAQQALEVTDLRVQDLQTLVFERDPLSSPENMLRETHLPRQPQFVTAVRTAKVDAHDPLHASPLFGVPKSADETYSPEEAELGFALASPVLALQEGRRTISVVLQLGYASEDSERIVQQVVDRVAEIQLARQPGESDVNRDAFTRGAFFQVFRQLFNIELTAEGGWYRVEEYLPLHHTIDADCPPDTLQFSMQLDASVAAVIGWDAQTHGGGFDTGFPVIRFVFNADNYLCPVSLFRGLLFESASIDVEVEGAKNLMVYSDLGRLGVDAPFQPFGPSPRVGSYFMVGFAETAGKSLTGFEIDLRWGALPSDRRGFEEFYEDYGLNLNNSDFRVSLTYLNDGHWLPEKNIEQPREELFKNAPGRGIQPLPSLAPARTLSCRGLFGISPTIENTQRPEDGGVYSAATKSGFFRFTLVSPQTAFGFVEYPRRLSEVLTRNARRRFFEKPVAEPRPPYIPRIDSVFLNYRATARIRRHAADVRGQDRAAPAFFHIHPYGVENITAASHRKVRLVPLLNESGHLFIGLSGSRAGGRLTLLFNLREDSLPISAPVEYSWYYLTSNHWVEIPRHRLVQDSTRGFLSSGLVVLDLPAEINRDNTIMPAQCYWLRVSADQALGRVCSVRSVSTQGICVRRDPGSCAEDAPVNLPSGSIRSSRVAIPGIARVDQLMDAFGGAAVETVSELKTRVSERLRHRQRAVGPRDYEQLILQHFPQIHKVRCIPHTVDDDRPDARTRAGNVLIVVVPYGGANTQRTGPPRLNGRVLKNIREFVSALAPTFATVRVRNPAYERVQVRCSVLFRAAEDRGRSMLRLNQAISDYLSPWSESGTGAEFDWCIRRYDLESFIRKLDYVEFVSGVSVLQVSADSAGRYRMIDSVKADGRNLDPVAVYPWSLAVPVRSHLIEALESASPVDAQSTGLGRLQLGSTFICARENYGEDK